MTATSVGRPRHAVPPSDTVTPQVADPAAASPVDRPLSTERLRGALRNALTRAGLFPDHVQYVTVRVLEDLTAAGELAALVRSPSRADAHSITGRRYSSTQDRSADPADLAGYGEGWAAACDRIAVAVAQQLRGEGRRWLSDSSVHATQRAARIAHDLRDHPGEAATRARSDQR
jgi:hypothetical protein